MKDLKVVLNFVQGLIQSPWEAFLKLLLVVLIAAILFTGYQVHFNNLKIYNPKTLVVIKKESLGETSKVLEEIRHTNKCVQAIAVYVYQPKSLPKREAELVLLQTAGGYANVELHKFFKEDLGHFPINARIYRTLTRNEVMDIDGTSDTSLDYELQYDCEINYARIYALYKYGAVYGSIVVLFNRPENVLNDSKEFNELSTDLYMNVRYINDIMFNIDRDYLK